MAAIEAATPLAGPSFAPEDPTLPKPWKGLIDGSTGMLYYWNPETNVTQYEKPADSALTLPPGLSSASQLNASPSQAAQTIQVNGSLPQQQSGQQTLQQSYQHAQQQQSQPQLATQQIPRQQLQQQLPYQQQQPLQSQQPIQTFQQPSPQYSHLQQPQYQQIQYMQGPPMPRAQGQFPYQSSQQPQPFQFPYHQGQQLPGKKFQQDSTGMQPPESQVGHQLGQQIQGSHTSQQLGQALQVPPATHEQGHNSLNQHSAQQQVMQSHVPQFFKQQEMIQQGQQPAQHQSQQFGFPGAGDAGHNEGKLAGYPPSIVQHDHPADRQLSGLPQHSQIRQAGANVYQPQLQHQLGAPVSNNQQQGGIGQSHQATMDSSHHQLQTGGSMFPGQIGHSMVQPTVGLKTSYEDHHHERGENYSSGRTEGPRMHAMQPKLAPLPLAQNKQDVRVGTVPPKFLSPGHSGGYGMLPGRTVPNMYSDAAFPNASPVRPPPRIFAAPDSPNISVDAYRLRHEVSAMGDDIPAPYMTFETTGFPPEILREIHAAGFLYPTPIQAQTWPVALQNRDIVAIAKTGSGKTLGYIIPAFIHLSQRRNNPQLGPTVLILAPTRELATQIQDEAMKFGRSSRISCTCLYGGAPKGPQLKEIERGVDIVVATPGRLNDILEMGKINFRQISFLVLDEADRMLDMGFEIQIRKIVNEIPSRRQTLMYTATWPMEVRKIAGDLLINPVQVNIGNVDELVANKSITQYVEVVPQMDKQKRLEQILRSQERGNKVIIFCSTKKLCDQLARSIGRTFGAIAIHGDKSQTERDHVLNQFKTGRFPVLVATDVAARGLDIKDIKVVVNYDFPTGIEDYVHRIGRTGRAGATGISYTFFTDQDWKHATELVKLLEGANQGVPPEIREMATRTGPPAQRSLPHGGMSRWDSGASNGGGRMDFGGGRMDSGGGRMDSGGGRGMREFSRGGGSGRGFGGRGGRNDFYSDGGSGRGFGGRGGRTDFYNDGRGGGRGRGFGRVGWGRQDRGGGGPPPPRDRFQNSDGRGRYEGGRGFGDRSRGRSYSRSRSPEKSRSWRHGRSRSRSSSRSRSWSRSWSPRSRSPSPSRSHDRYNQPQPGETRRRRVSGFDAPLSQPPVAGLQEPEAPRRVSGFDAPLSVAPAAGGAPPEPNPHVSGFDAPLAGQMSPMSPGHGNGTFTGGELGN